MRPWVEVRLQTGLSFGLGVERLQLLVSWLAAQTHLLLATCVDYQAQSETHCVQEEETRVQCLPGQVSALVCQGISGVFSVALMERISLNVLDQMAFLESSKHCTP